MSIFPLDPTMTAVVSIDMHRGHLDPAVATMPLPAERCAPLLERTRALFEAVRSVGVPIVHVVTTYRDEAEISSSPIWLAKSKDASATRRNALRHNLEGGPGTELMPGLHRAGEPLLTTKKRYSSFLGTELDWLLRSRLNADTLILVGVNTNTCVLCAVFEACNRDYRVIVASDCVDTMDGPDLHSFALQTISVSLGWTWNNASIAAALGASSRSTLAGSF
jgi:nicotinamidase-related amidase